MVINFENGVTFEQDATLKWYKSSENGERGFCSECGTSLFWREPGAGNDVAISVGTLDDGHGLGIKEHIWVDDKPEWYEFSDTAPRLTAAQALGQQE